MYVCICNAVTESQIREAANAGTRNLWDLTARLGVAAGCGCCREQAAAVLRDARSSSCETAVRRPPAAWASRIRCGTTQALSVVPQSIATSFVSQPSGW